MKHFDLIFDACKELNALLKGTFINKDLFFREANISEIVYGMDQNSIVFSYYPDKYEYGKIMTLKAVYLRLDFNAERQYSINELGSFFQNQCEYFENSNTFKSTEDQIESLSAVLQQLESNKSNWEEKFVRYKNSISPEW